MSKKRNNPKRQLPKRRKPKNPPSNMRPSYGRSQMLCSTTPREITPRIIEFAKRVAGTEPMRIAVKPLAPAMRCHYNAKQYAEEFGGRVVNGWMVWEGPAMLEAEFHAVVEKDGKYIDISKKPDGEKEIVFFEDAKRNVAFTTEGEYTVIDTYHNVNARDCEVKRRKALVENYKAFKFPAQ